MLRDIEEELLKEVDKMFPNQERGMAEAITIVGIALDKFEALFNSNLKEEREGELRIDRIWAMPNKWTFTIKPIKELLKEEVTEGLWCDPFAGMNSPAQVTNDLNPAMPTTHHLPAIEFLKSLESNSFDGVLYDPPYSPRQVKECYESIAIDGWDKKWDGRTTFWSETMDEVARIIKPNGKLICFGWTSMGGSMSRGFKMQRILLVPHGGRKNDTICTVETKVGVSKTKQSSQTNMTLFEATNTLEVKV